MTTAKLDTDEAFLDGVGRTAPVRRGQDVEIVTFDNFGGVRCYIVRAEEGIAAVTEREIILPSWAEAFPWLI